jgi:hypothetical protein
MRKQLTEKELLARLGTLPREIAPDNDVWPAIAGRIEQRQQASSGPESSNPWWFRAAAASVALAIAVGILLGRQWSTTAGPMQPVSASTAHSLIVHTDGLSGTLAASELEYQAAFREFISIGKSGDLTLETIAKLDDGWAELRKAEAGLRIALLENPGNLFLNTKMLELRSRQLGFLKHIAAMDKSSRRISI